MIKHIIIAGALGVLLYSVVESEYDRLTTWWEAVTWRNSGCIIDYNYNCEREEEAMEVTLNSLAKRIMRLFKEEQNSVDRKIVFRVVNNYQFDEEFIVQEVGRQGENVVITLVPK